MAGQAAITLITGRFFVTDYGAKCDGTTDDAVAVQAAIDAAITVNGTVVFPASRCKIGTTLRVGASSGTTTTYVSLEGVNMLQSEIYWTGSTSTPAIKFVRNKRFRMKHLTVRNSVAKGTTIGVLQTGYGGAGTETLGGYFEQVCIVGFAVGIQAGQTSGLTAAASDSEYRSLQLDGNDVGFLIVEGNSKNHYISNLQMADNGIGMEIVAGSAWITGGASSSNDTDFKITTQVFTVRDFYAELSTGAIFLDIIGGGTFTVQGCHLSDSIDATTIGVRATGTVTSINVTDCSMFCRILINVSPWMLSVSNSYLWGDTTYPFFFGGSAGTINKVNVKNVINHEGDPAVSPTFTLVANYEGSVVP